MREIFFIPGFFGWPSDLYWWLAVQDFFGGKAGGAGVLGLGGGISVDLMTGGSPESVMLLPGAGTGKQRFWNIDTRLGDWFTWFFC